MDKIRVLRQERGWTQEELGRKVKVKKAAISKYENGSISPSIEMIRELSRIFGVSTDYLLDTEQNNRSDVYHLNKEQLNLLQNYESLNPDGQNLLNTLITSLLMSHSRKEVQAVQQNNGHSTVINVGSNNSATFR